MKETSALRKNQVETTRVGLEKTEQGVPSVTQQVAERFLSHFMQKKSLYIPKSITDIDQTMTAQGETEKSEIGAGTAKSLSVPQLSPIFSFHSEGGGDVYIYALSLIHI